MSWISSLLDYPAASVFLSRVIQDNDTIFDNLLGYLDKIQQKFGKLIARTQAALAGKPFVPADLTSQASISSVRSFTESVPSKFIAAPDVCFAPFKFAHGTLPELSRQLKDLRNQYHGKIQEIRNTMDGDLNRLTEARNRSSSAYALYERAADNLRSAADRKSGDLAELKSAFVNAQKTAIDLHTSTNEMMAFTAMRMEIALTAYEEAEEWKSQEIKKFVGAVADWGDKVAAKFTSTNERLNEMKQMVLSDEVLAKIFDGSNLPDPRACLDFVVIRVDPLVAQLLEGNVLFPNAAKENTPLMKVTRTCAGNGQRLAVAQNDTVCQLEDKGDAIIARTMNDVEGLIPKAALQ